MERKHQKRRSWALTLAGIGLLVCGSGLAARAQVTIKAEFVPRKEIKEKNAPDPNALNDVVRLESNADSASGIARVTFEVDEQFRVEVKQPPFTYDWDTLAEKDGQHTLTITAYNTNAQNSVKRLKVVVKNQLELGIKHWVAKGLDAFDRGDGVALEKAARKAYRVSRIDTDAIRIMALNRGVKGDPNGGFGMLDDQQNNVPKDEPFTLRVRAALYLIRSSQQGNVDGMLPDLREGMGLLRLHLTAVMQQVQAAHPATENDGAGQITRGDALYNDGQNEGALTAYERAAQMAGDTDAKRKAQQRQVMTLLRMGRLAEAENLAIRLVKGASPTVMDGALYGVVLFQERKYIAARESVAGGVQAKHPLALIVATLSDLAQGQRELAYNEAKSAVDTYDCAETQYAALAALADAGLRDPALRTFRIVAQRAPLYMPNLVERAYDMMAYETNEDRFIQAMNLLNFVLVQDPNNAPALAGRITALLHLKRFNMATPQVAELARLTPTAPEVFVFRAALVSKGKLQDKTVNDAIAYAAKLDPENFKAKDLPEMAQFVTRLAKWQRVIPITPRLLDNADHPPVQETIRTAAY